MKPSELPPDGWPVIDDDFEIHIWPPTPRGGQHVGCRVGILLIHKPTGVAVVEESERSQVKCRAKALARLQSLLQAIGYYD